MVSIREAVDTLERIHAARQRVLECYLTALRDGARYAVELDDAITPAHRKALEDLADQVGAGDDDTLDASKGFLRAILRDYRDRASAYLGSLKDELANTARAFEEILESLSRADGDEETRLRNAVRSLREISGSPAASSVRAAILSAANTIDESLDQLRKQHQLVVAQMQIEIGMLHKRIDTLEAAAAVDSVTKLLKRSDMEQLVRDADDAYCLLLARVGGFHAAEKTYQQGFAEELAGAFTKRLRNSVPHDAKIARWGYEDFVVMVSIGKLEATPIAKWVAEHLSGTYSLLHEGKLVNPRLQVSVAVVEGGAGRSAFVLERICEFLKG